jgi:hypothetical protein
MKDWAYQAAFEKEDLPYLYKFARKVRRTHDIRLVEDYLTKCQQKIDDHNPILQVGNKCLEFAEVVKSDDLVVNGGLQQYINIVLGISAVRWRYIGYGFGTTATLVTDTTLASEFVTPRIDTTLFGWALSQGLKLFFGGVIGESVNTASISELGVFNNSSGVTMLNRNMFSGNTLTRTLGNAVFILSSVIELVPTV